MRSLAAALAAYLAFAAPCWAQSCTPITAFMQADTGSPGIVIPTTFVGASWEFGPTGLGGGFLTDSTTALVNLMRILGPNGVVRIGGGSSNTVANSTITAPIVAGLHRFVAALGPGWTVTMGVDAGNNDTAGATTLVSLFEAEFGAGVVPYQLGNEPDINLTHWANQAVFLAGWDTFKTAIRVANPSATFLGPDIFNSVYSGSGWVGAFVASKTGSIVGASQHFYPDTHGTITQQSFLTWSHDELAIIASDSVRAAAGLPMHMTETNTLQVDGIGNSSAAASWVIDTGIQLAEAGWQSMQMHATGQFRAIMSPSYVPTPAFSGLFLLSNVNGQTILPLTSSGNNSTLTIMPTVDGSGVVHFLMVNRSTTAAVDILITQPGPWTTQSVLLAQGAPGNDRIELVGGAQIGLNGAWSGAPTSVPNGTSFSLPANAFAYVTLN